MEYETKARYWITTLCGLGLFLLIYIMMSFFGTEPSIYIDMTRAGLVIAITILGIVTLMFWGWWTVDRALDEYERYQNARWTSPLTVGADAIRGLPMEALKLLPEYKNEMEVEYELTPDGPIGTFKTPIGSLSMEWFYDYLRQSDVVKCRSERSYNIVKDNHREVNREQCRRAVALLLEKRLIFVKGDEPPLWISPDARARAFKMAGLELYENESGK